MSQIFHTQNVILLSNLFSSRQIEFLVEENETWSIDFPIINVANSKFPHRRL